MNKRRGKAITGEFKNEVLHFGKLISEFKGLIFFSARIENNHNSQCVAVVLDGFSQEKELPISVGEYVRRVNVLAEQFNFISPIVELGMAPDSKPFLISEEPVGTSLDSFTFLDRGKLKDFFHTFWKVFLNLEEYGVDVSYIDSKSIFVDSNHPLMFPAVRFLIAEDPTEEYLGLSGQKNSSRVFKSILANSLFWNRHIFSDNEQLEARLLELADDQIEAFLDGLDNIVVEQDGVSEKESFGNTFDLNSFDEIDDLKVHNEFSEVKEHEEIVPPEKVTTRFELEDDEDEEREGFEKVSRKVKDIWILVQPIVLKLSASLINFLMSLPRKMQIGLGVVIIVIILLIFGGGRSSKGKLLEDGLTQSSELRQSSAVVVEREASAEPDDRAGTKEGLKSKPQQNDNNAETEINKTNDKAEGIRSQQTKDDLAAIQSLQGQLKENQIRVLVQLTKSDDFEVRIASIRTLGEKAPKGNVEVRDSLIGSLSDHDYLVRGFAVSAITAYLESDSVPILEAHREKEESEIVVAAIDRAIKRLETYKSRK